MHIAEQNRIPIVPRQEDAIRDRFRAAGHTLFMDELMAAIIALRREQATPSRDAAPAGERRAAR